MAGSSSSTTMTTTGRVNGSATGKASTSKPSNGSTGGSSKLASAAASSNTKKSSTPATKSATSSQDKKPRMSSSTSSSALPPSSRVPNGHILPAPVASTSKAVPFPSASTNQRADQAVRMSWVEVQIHNAICAAERRTMSASKVLQLDIDLTDAFETPLEAVNGLLRKHLLKVGKNAQNEQVFVAVPKEEARELGMMDPDDKMVLDHITQSGNQGMWTRTLKTRTGMHQAVVNRVIKNLEQRKLIKNVKSVKHPTRKIYMLEQLVPSIELTGGPWYNGNELDTEFIEQLLGLAQKIVRAKSFPENDTNKMWPHAYIPYLPTANDILEILEKGNALHVNLSVEHVESVLNVLVFDGIIERIWCRRYAEDGVSPAVTYEGTPPTSDTTTVKSHLPNGSIDYDRDKVMQAKKRKAETNGAPKRKKRRKRRQMSADSNDIDADSNNEAEDSAADSDISVGEEERYNNAAYSPEPSDLPPPLPRHTPTDFNTNYSRSRLHKRPGPAGNDWYYVYRTCLTSLPVPNGEYQFDTGLLDPQKHRIIETKQKHVQLYDLGFTQTPCGVCPVHEFCNNRGKPRVLPLPGERNLTDVDAVAGSTLTPAGKTSWRESEVVREHLKSIKLTTKNPGEADMHRALLKMKCPTGSGEAENAGGVWSGGGKVGGRMSAPVNPSNCVYFARWFGAEVQW